MSSPRVLASLYGNVVQWSTTIPGSFVSGVVPLATDAATLGGKSSDVFALADGSTASGTWNIDIAGSAALLENHSAADFAAVDGSNATGTWNIDIAGSAARLDGKLARDYALADGSSSVGTTWDINIADCAISHLSVLMSYCGNTPSFFSV